MTHFAVANCDDDICAELKAAGIWAVPAPEKKGKNSFTVMGRLGRFDFKRAWSYWIVEGLMPLDVAREIYATDIGRKDVRVAGHAGGPPPDEWAMPTFDDLKTKFADSGLTFPEIRKLCLEEGSGVPLFVHEYHIDSLDGLTLFANVIGVHGLV